MKILHISNVSQLSGWSKQAEMHLLALDLAGVDVTARNINIINIKNPDLHPRVIEFLNKDCKNPDIIIQNVLPNLLEKTGRAKCVSYFVCETSNFKSIAWASRMNLMDMCICPCFHNKEAAQKSGVVKKIEIVPECVDTSKYKKDYGEHAVRKNFKEKFLFLTIGEFTRRKDIESIVKAFHLEFSPNEPVELVIKTSPIGMSNPQQDINNKLEHIKRGLKLYSSNDKYKKENVVCGFLRDDDLYSLMQSCNAYVNASRGEAFCIPVVDAMGFGKVIISPNHSGLDYINDRNAYVVDSVEQPCFDAMDTLPELYTGKENWNEIVINSLRSNMRSAFEKHSLNIKKIQEARKTVDKFSLENIGQQYRKVLEKI